MTARWAQPGVSSGYMGCYTYNTGREKILVVINVSFSSLAYAFESWGLEKAVPI